MAGIEDCYTASRGSTKTLGNFVKATFFALAVSCWMLNAVCVLDRPCSMAFLTDTSLPCFVLVLQATYGFLTPDLWRETVFTKAPYQEFTDFLAKPTVGRAAY